jgi:hypothetical protein
MTSEVYAVIYLLNSEFRYVTGWKVLFFSYVTQF